MNRLLSFVFVLVLFCSGSFVIAQDGYRILFIGNSFTNYGPVPDIVRDIAVSAKHKEPFVFNAAVNGQSLQFHREHKPTLDAIDSGNWDYVVLQEYSTNPTDNIGNPAQFKENAVWLYDRIEKSSPSAKVVMYETWARHEEHQIYRKKDFDNRLQMQEQLIKHYRDCVENYVPANAKSEVKNDILLAPVGELWHANYMGKNIMLHGDDLYHAGNVGQYANALVLFATIYNSSVAGLEPKNGVSSEQASYLQGLTDKINDK